MKWSRIGNKVRRGRTTYRRLLRPGRGKSQVCELIATRTITAALSFPLQPALPCFLEIRPLKDVTADWLTEGFNTADLKEAKALLD